MPGDYFRDAERSARAARLEAMNVATQAYSDRLAYLSSPEAQVQNIQKSIHMLAEKTAVDAARDPVLFEHLAALINATDALAAYVQRSE